MSSNTTKRERNRNSQYRRAVNRLFTALDRIVAANAELRRARDAVLKLASGKPSKEDIDDE